MPEPTMPSLLTALAPYATAFTPIAIAFITTRGNDKSAEKTKLLIESKKVLSEANEPQDSQIRKSLDALITENIKASSKKATPLNPDQIKNRTKAYITGAVLIGLALLVGIDPFEWFNPGWSTALTMTLSVLAGIAVFLARSYFSKASVSYRKLDEPRITIKNNNDGTATLSIPDEKDIEDYTRSKKQW